MKAAPADQLHLLDLARLDVAIAQAERARKNPEHAAKVQELIAQRQAEQSTLARLLGERDDAHAELARLESDVAVVDARAQKDAERLATTSDPKQAISLEHEIASLTKRKSDLEDAELVLMERIEAADSAVAAQEALIAQINDEGARLSAIAKDAVAEATERLTSATRDRAAVAGRVSPALLARYELLASRSAGAGLLRRRTCEGCNMMLNETELQVVRAASDDEVLECPQCGCILVRTDETGL